LDFRVANPPELPRAEVDVDSVLSVVEPVVQAIKWHGLPALQQFTQQFDKVVPEHFSVNPAELTRALEELDPKLRQAFETAIERRRQVAADEALEVVTTKLAPGASVTNRPVPVRRVGLYVPGGLAPLCSTVLMNVIPAQVAGVGSIAVCSPPQAEFNGLPHPSVLAMCALLGVDEVYAAGGAQAIAMLAYGIEGLCQPVDMITGPGNVYVTAAKRLVRSKVNVDAEAGPTEIMVLADGDANPVYVAADLVSQAEHDPLAAAVLVSDSHQLITAVRAELTKQVNAAKHAKRIRTALQGPQSAAILVRDLEQAVEVANEYAAEHLEIHTKNAAAVAAQITNAGAVFVGPYAPVPLGDYTAGSTHVLPTSGFAHASSGLTVRSFTKTMQVIEYSKAAFAKVAEVVEEFGATEDLPAHAFAASVRKEPEK
jgi:histidinol dehydrogenase